MNLRLHCQLLEVLCEDLQTDIVCHDHFCRHAALVVVCGGRIELGQQETGLTAVLIAVDKVRNGETPSDDAISFLQWLLHWHTVIVYTAKLVTTVMSIFVDIQILQS